jgi:hypothetical protein
LKARRGEKVLAAWAGATTRLWILCSLVVACVLDVLASFADIGDGRKYGLLDFAPLQGHSLLLILLGPLYHLTEIFGLAAIAAAVASLLGSGPFAWRFGRILRPWSLVQVPISLVGLIGLAIGTPLGTGHDNLLVSLLGRAISAVALSYPVYTGLVALALGTERFRARVLLDLIVIVSWLGILLMFVWAAGWLESFLKLHA